MSNRSHAAGLGGFVAIVVGILITAAFYGVVWASPSPAMHRYFLGHPVAFVATTLFWVALSCLAQRWLYARSEQSIIRGLALSEIKPELGQSDTVESVASPWLNHLSSLPRGERRSQLIARVEEILSRQLRRKTARFLNDDIREISEREADDSHDSLQLIRTIVWAIPMLGFLGTVIGITQTLGGLDFTDAQNAVDKLKAGLYVAFDTTALGLVLSVVAIFLQLPVEKRLGALLSDLDERTIDIFFGAFPDESPADEPLAAIAEMNRKVLASVNQLVEKQADLWKSTVDSAHQHWASVVGTAGDQVQSALADAIDSSLEKHAEFMRQAQESSLDQVDQRWQQWQVTLSENARVLLSQQQALAEQNELLSASGARAEELLQLRQLFETNLRSLSVYPDLTDAMRGLAVAIQDIRGEPTSTDRSAKIDAAHAQGSGTRSKAA